VKQLLLIKRLLRVTHKENRKNKLISGPDWSNFHLRWFKKKGLILVPVVPEHTSMVIMMGNVEIGKGTVVVPPGSVVLSDTGTVARELVVVSIFG